MVVITPHKSAKDFNLNLGSLSKRNQDGICQSSRQRPNEENHIDPLPKDDNETQLCTKSMKPYLKTLEQYAFRMKCLNHLKTYHRRIYTLHCKTLDTKAMKGRSCFKVMCNSMSPFVYTSFVFGNSKNNLWKLNSLEPFKLNI